MIGDDWAPRRKVDHLSADLVDHISSGQMRPTAPAAQRPMLNDHVRFSPLQVCARRAGLFALTALGGPGLGTPLRPRLSSFNGVGRRRFRRRVRVLPRLALKARHAITQPLVLRNKTFDLGLQGLVLCPQLFNDGERLSHLLPQRWRTHANRF
jgi:hypothetical protein